MRKILYALSLTLFVSSCGNQSSTEEAAETKAEEVTEDATDESTNVKMIDGMMSFGEEITAEGAITGAELFAQLQENDSLEVTVSSSVNSVCQKKGCWMKLDLADGEDMMVRFKDYGFFVPLNSENNEVVVRGKVKKSIIPVAELQHYAEDDGQTEEEIAAITEPEETYTFMADGVLMKVN